MPACSAICRTARLMDTALPPHSSQPSPTLCITIPWAEHTFLSERTPGSIATGGWYADSGTTQDGTGLTLNLGTGTSLDGKITRRDGSIVSLPNVSTPSYVDTNGNKITTDGTNYFDTLGATALTISGAAPSPVSYTFPNSSGGNSVVTANYTTFTIQTNFQCAGD